MARRAGGVGVKVGGSHGAVTPLLRYVETALYAGDGSKRLHGGGVIVIVLFGAQGHLAPLGACRVYVRSLGVSGAESQSRHALEVGVQAVQAFQLNFSLSQVQGLAKGRSRASSQLHGLEPFLRALGLRLRSVQLCLLYTSDAADEAGMV